MDRLRVSETAWKRLLSGKVPKSAAGEVFGPLAASRRFVMAQVGQSLDGRVATVSGDAQDISGREGLRHLHRCRALADAVVVGLGTVAADDPSLSVRLVSGPSPVRVVIDCEGRMPRDAKLLHDDGTKVLVMTAAESARPVAGAEVVPIPRSPRGLCPAAIIDALAARGLHKVLVEGGAKTIARFVDAGLIDRMHVAVSPFIIGAGPSGIALPPVQRLSEALHPRVSVYDMGTDVLFDCAFERARPDRSARPAQGEQVEMPNFA